MKALARWTPIATAALAQPVVAQHQHMPGMTMPGMTMPAPTKPNQNTKKKPAPKKAQKAAPRRTVTKPKTAAPDTQPMPAMPGMNHATMDHAAMAPEVKGDQGTMDHSTMDHGGMDHSTMDHGGMDHGSMPGMAMAASPVPSIETPPPPGAGSGPARAADRIWGAEAMRASRDDLRRHHGAQRYAAIIVDRFEYRARKGADGYLWDGDGWIGGDIDKFWVRSEGEGEWQGRAERAEVQALWSHAVGPWFDLQTGVRQDIAGPARTSLAVGLRGLAPYMFDVNIAGFVSTRGEVSSRIEAELDQRITQRLRLQPRVELNLAAQNVPERGVGAGLDRIELGARLRYEVVREFAPYIGIEQEWRLGRSADFARAAGDRPNSLNVVTGVRFWF